MTDIRSLERTLLDNLPWNKARIKFVARFLLALYAMRTVNLSVLATAFSGQAREDRVDVPANVGEWGGFVRLILGGSKAVSGLLLPPSLLCLCSALLWRRIGNAS